jgi:hypothetical protein
MMGKLGMVFCLFFFGLESGDVKTVYSNGFSATPSLVGVPEFRSFHIGRSSGLDITRGGQRDNAASAYVLRPL